MGSTLVFFRKPIRDICFNTIPIFSEAIQRMLFLSRFHSSQPHINPCCPPI